MPLEVNYAEHTQTIFGMLDTHDCFKHGAESFIVLDTPLENGNICMSLDDGRIVVRGFLSSTVVTRTCQRATISINIPTTSIV